jgi:hypothetical protein
VICGCFGKRRAGKSIFSKRGRDFALAYLAAYFLLTHNCLNPIFTSSQSEFCYQLSIISHPDLIN